MRCMLVPHIPGLSAILQKKPHCLVLHSLRVSTTSSASPRWGICWLGAWRSQNNCCGTGISESNRWQNAWATGRQAPSVSRLRDMRECPQLDMRARQPKKRRWSQSPTGTEARFVRPIGKGARVGQFPRIRHLLICAIPVIGMIFSHPKSGRVCRHLSKRLKGWETERQLSDRQSVREIFRYCKWLPGKADSPSQRMRQKCRRFFSV